MIGERLEERHLLLPELIPHNPIKAGPGVINFAAGSNPLGEG